MKQTNTVDCPDCDGDGWQEHLTENLQYHSWLCERCNGTGKVSDLVLVDSEATTDVTNPPQEQLNKRRKT